MGAGYSMMKLSFSLIFILIALPLYANPCMQMLMGGTTATGSPAGCNVATNEVAGPDYANYNTYSETTSFSNGYIFCQLSTADCSGDLEYAKLKHRTGSVSDHAKVCVYNAVVTNTPNSASNTQIACSAEIEGTDDATWYDSPDKLGGSVGSGTYYWVCVLGGTGSWDTYRTTTSTLTSYFRALDTGEYATPAANLAGTYSYTASREYAVYVRIE